MREYRLSPKFDRKRESTKREDRRMLTRLEDRFGTMPIRALAAPRVVAKFIDYQEEIGRRHPPEANRLTILATVFSYAQNKGSVVIHWSDFAGLTMMGMPSA
jgi:hypothetical protein